MFTSAFSRLFDARKVWLYLIGAVALGVLGNATYELLKQAFGERPAVIVGFALLVLLAIAFALWMWLNRPAAIVPPARAQPVPRRGLILLVGKQEDTCRAAIKHHAPALNRLWLICSAQSADTAANLAGFAELPPGVMLETINVKDVFDPRTVFDAVVDIYRRLPDGWRPADAIADFTGMTAPASVGMVLACLQTGGPIEYTPGEYNETLRAIRALPPIELLFIPVAQLAPSSDEHPKQPARP